ncbi:polysaccharide deacetylase family protein [Janibacter sp. GS2]|uniref:polysaccharide deacetylase family protein n=1 Tax=Janibacter sp. GS2 TaxID=3442646 RepID=UPI003EBA5898
MSPVRRVALTSSAAVAVALGGCASPAEPGGQESTPSGGSSPSEDSSTDTDGPSSRKRHRTRLNSATTAAAQYDYAGALKELKGLTGTDVDALTRKITKQQTNAVTWPDNSQISHLFFHSLIVDADRAFTSQDSAQGYADYMVTIDEFKAVLDSVHEKGYVLVNPRDVARENAQGQMEYVPITLPKGKKPLVISQDDVSYYEYMDGDGFAQSMTLDDDGGVTNTYEDPDGKTVEGSYDMPAVVDDFVEEHPDFSYRGSKGVLALTGYNGVLGYRTSEIEYGDEEDIDLQEQQEQAKGVADELKEDGWVFASHSWGHTNFTKATMTRLTADTQKWDEEVAPILGETDLLIFPFGADIGGTQDYSGPKYDLLEEHGFDFYFGIDTSAPAWGQRTDDYVRQARINVDGLSMSAAMKDDQHVLHDFFDVEEVIDPTRAEHGF